MDLSEGTPQEFRLYLQQELSKRCKHNPHFSLRAFARTLDVEVSSLSKILNGKRSLSRKMLHHISSQLGLSPERVNYFEEKLPSRKRKQQMEFTQLTMDTFTVISDWYHYAILELVTVKDFTPSKAWVAKRLGITVSEVNFAIERLQRLDMLEVNGDTWEQKSGQLTTIGSNFTASALKKLQNQILTQAQDALQTTKIERRDQSAMTMAIDSSKIADAKRLITKFRRDLCAFLQDTSDPDSISDGKPHKPKNKKDEVYQLSISLFPVSKTTK